MFEETRRRKEGRTYDRPYDDTQQEMQAMRELEASQDDQSGESVKDPFDEVMGNARRGTKLLQGLGATRKKRKDKGPDTSLILLEEVMEAIKMLCNSVGHKKNTCFRTPCMSTSFVADNGLCMSADHLAYNLSNSNIGLKRTEKFRTTRVNLPISDTQVVEEQSTDKGSHAKVLHKSSALLGKGPEKVHKWVRNHCPAKHSGGVVEPSVPPILELQVLESQDSGCLPCWVPRLGGCPFKATKRQMKIVAWNCRGLGLVGVDSVGLSGGFCVFWFALVVIDPLLVSPHVILCRIVKNLVTKYVLFMYGAPQVYGRTTMWSEIYDILAAYPNFVLIGDFNHVEYLSDKVGGNPDIPGRQDFIQWKLDNGLLDILFSGPSFTWTNGRIVMDPTFERLLSIGFRIGQLPQFITIPFCFQIIRLLFYVTLCLLVDINDLNELKTGACNLWRLCVLCHRLLAWCVSHKNALGIDWKALVQDVTNASFTLDSRSSRCLFSTFRMEKITEAQAAFLFWRHRAIVKWDAFGDEHTRLLFSAVQARRRKNTILGLKDNAGPWVLDAQDIRSLLPSLSNIVSPCSSIFG
uniref:Endonuclease/exonuclease/phosphatase domain-containing protein n=1 Tax=Chenopodium quinoa TaxID=63459 RepID=A0A803MK75_CHEQI